MQAIKAKHSQAAWAALRELFCRPSGKQNAEHRTWDTGHRTLQTGHTTVDYEHRTPNAI